jgi:hypothetical protein
VDLAGFAGPLIALRPARAAAVDVVPGDAVVLRIAPTASAPELHAVTADAVLLDRRSGGGATQLVLKLRDPRDAGRVLDVAGRGEVVLTPAADPTG